MPTFCLITPNQSSTSNDIFALLGRDNFNSIAKAVSSESGIAFRKRKFDLFQYSTLTIAKFNTSEKVLANTLSRLHSNYRNKASLDESEKSISDKCLHKALQSDRTLSIVKALTEQVLAVASRRIAKLISKALSEYKLKALVDYLGVNDIILIDGTEVESSKGAIDNLGIKAKGRTNTEGNAANPCFKLHIAYSVLKQTFEYVEITGGVDSERDRVYFKDYKNTLFIMDAGYSKDELEDDISSSGNFFLVKGKKNMAGSVIKSITVSDGTLNLEHRSLKVSQLPINKDLDLIVKKKTNTKVRVVTRFNPNASKVEDSRVILRTNLSKDLLSHVLATMRK